MTNATQFPTTEREYRRWMQSRVATLERSLGPTAARVAAAMGNSTEERLAGAIIAFAGEIPPEGYALCDGTELNRVTDAVLFGVIGTTYGPGDGSTTFNTPNVKGRVLVGADPAQAEFDVLGETGGEKTHTLTDDEMPVHTHVQNAHNHAELLQSGNLAPAQGVYVTVTDGGSTRMALRSTGAAPTLGTSNTTATNQDAGGDDPHNNLQPYLVINYAICKGTATGGMGSGGGGGGGSGAVDSVNGQTGVVVLDSDDISDVGHTNKWSTAAEKAKLAAIPTDLGVIQTTVLTSISGNGTVTLAKSARMESIQFSGAGRFRLYRRSAGRTSDAARSFTTPYPGNFGMLYDYEATGAQTDEESPVPIAWGSGETSYFYAATGPVTVTITWVKTGE
jgi:microcystin-dependent protein